MKSRRVAILVTSVAAALAATAAVPVPALAAEVCHPVFSFGTQTVEVLGEPVWHSPRGDMWICLESPDGLPTVPSLEVSTSPARLVQLVHPDAGGGEYTVTIQYNLATYDGTPPQQSDFREVTLPIPMDGGSTCLFFQGNEVYNPGGCVLALNGVIPAVDEIFDSLP